MLRSLYYGLLDAVLPQTCLVCNEWIAAVDAPLCPICREKLAVIQISSYCPRCGRTAPSVTLDEDGCGQCRSESHWNIKGLVRLGGYEPELRQLVLGLKYAGHERNIAYLAAQLAAALRRQPWCKDLDGLVPVPMHLLRRLQRPCDHAALLTQALSKQLKIPVLRVARRHRYAPSQTQALSRAQRFENVEDCFAPARRRASRAAGKTLCIIDNVTVTGATLHEVSKVLRKLGAKRIYAAIIARSVIPGDFQAALPALPASTHP